jgi:two-component sensor histidine kinase
MALSLAIALHELCTNAAEYGALSNADGRVRIAWQVSQAPAGPRLLLRCDE